MIAIQYDGIHARLVLNRGIKAIIKPMKLHRFDSDFILNSILPPLTILAAAGIVMGVGYTLCPASMQGGAITLASEKLGLVLVRTGGAITDNAGFLFAASFGYACSNRKLEGVLYGLGIWLIFSSLCSPYFIQELLPSLAEESFLTFLPSPFTGTLCGIGGGWMAKNAEKKGTAYGVGLSIILAMAGALILVPLWLLACRLAVMTGTLLADGNAGSSALFSILNRVLMPLNLHHALNQPVLFANGNGDLTRYWANRTDLDPGRYMSGFFAPMICGSAGCALALVQHHRDNHPMRSFLCLAVIGAAISGFTEPLEFLILLAAPLLFAGWCVLFGLFSLVSVWSGFRAGFALSGGLADLFFSAQFPAAARTWMIVPLGMAAFVLYYVITRLFLKQGRQEGTSL